MSIEEEIIKESSKLEAEFGGKSLGFLLFTMGMKFNTLDYEKLYRDNVTDREKDKKVDFFNFSRESGEVSIAQSYQSRDWNKPNPPLKKASDLNSAVNWLLEAHIDLIPEESVKPQAIELRDALDEGAVSLVEVMMVHNLSANQDVRSELAVVEKALRDKLNRWQGPGGFPIRALAHEVSFNTAVDWYNSSNSIIAILDEVLLTSMIEPQPVEGEEWKAMVVSLKGEEIVDIAEKYGDKLYVANVRDFLGVRSSSRNINGQIERTAKENPSDFWVFNNGITLITRKYEPDGKVVKCDGLAVINGAQTIGSLAESMPNENIDKVGVPGRIVSANKDTVINNIIRYNNTQNPIKAWELRVNDPVQGRIKKELEEDFGLVYQLRRGNTRRSAEDIHYEKVGTWLNSFYGDPISSHRNSPDIYEQDAKYSSIFSNSSVVRNILFVYRLGETIGIVKDELKMKYNDGIAGEDDKELYGYFRFPAFSYVVLSICAKALKYILRVSTEDFVYKVKMKDDELKELEKAKGTLEGLVKVVVAPIVPYLKGKQAYNEFKIKAGIDAITDAVKGDRLREYINLYKDRYMSVPASTTHHHVYTGGLMQHSIEVIEIAISISLGLYHSGKLHPDIDMTDFTNKIILIGVIHDMQKVMVYEKKL